jgi:Kdo2-lipid IVA lauroyltransferase/acyltransferase
LFIRLIFRVLAALPLTWAQAIGALLGGLVYRLGAGGAKRARQHVGFAMPSVPAAERAAIARASHINQGRLIGETAHIWLRPEATLARVENVTGWQHVEAARARNQAMLFLVPHLGGFELGGQYLNERIPMVALYRPPKLAALAPLMKAGRDRGEGETFSADLAGVRNILKAMKAGKSLMILPDQAPQEGEGVWAPFFGHPAYTMTLAARLAEKTGAAPLLVSVPRTKAAGFEIIIEPLPAPLPQDRLAAATLINQAVEHVALRHPQQYQWQYNRYKHPAGAPPPPADGAAQPGGDHAL